MYAFDPATRAWTTLPSDGGIEQHNAVLAARDGKLVRVGGGCSEVIDGKNWSVPCDVITEFDPAANAWQTIGRTPRWIYPDRVRSHFYDGSWILVGELADNHVGSEKNTPTWIYRVKGTE